MAQLRIYDYGDNVTTPDDNLTRLYLQAPGVYSGLELSAATTSPYNIVIGAGAGLLQDGVMWVEEDETTLSFPTPGSPTNYTVYCTHVDRQITDGVPVEYALQTGIITTVTNGIVLGWIYYTSGNLTTDMMVSAPAARPDTQTQALVDAAPIELLAPFPRCYSDVTGMGGNVTFTGQTATDVEFDTTFFVTHQRVEKTVGPAGGETLTQHFQFMMREGWRPSSFNLYCNIVGAGQLQLELRDTDLNTVTVTGSPVVGSTTDWEWQTVTVDRTDGTFDANKPFELRITSQVDLTQRVDLAVVRANFWPYPTT